MQCTEGTQRNCTVLAVIHESIIPARLFLSLPRISTPAAAQDLCSGSRAHPTVPTKPPGVQDRAGLVSGTGATCCGRQWLTLLASTWTTHLIPQAGNSHAPKGAEG